MHFFNDTLLYQKRNNIYLYLENSYNVVMDFKVLFQRVVRVIILFFLTFGLTMIATEDVFPTYWINFVCVCISIRLIDEIVNIVMKIESEM